MLLVLQRGVDGRYDLAYVDTDHCALGLSRGTLDTWEISWTEEPGGLHFGFVKSWPQLSD